MQGDRSLSDVFQDVLRNVQEIIRAEVSLAKAEIRQEASAALSSALWMIVGGVSGVFAVLFVLWTVAYALSLVWPKWAATLTIAAILAVAAAVLVVTGVRRFESLHPIPERTVETLKENVAWVKQSTK
jgi:uncharacterized membrane protein YqjE